MSATQDFVALDWIKGEIEQTLDQAQQALEAVAQSADDTGSMRSCLTSLHQVHGTLRMVELEGPTQLSAEMEELAQALMSSEVPDVGKAQEVLMQAILQMPAYLDRIQREQKDSPGTVRPIINNLRVARGEARLGGAEAAPSAGPSEIDALVAAPAAEVIAAFNQAGGGANVKKLRARYQQALVALLKRSNPRENLSLMGKVFTMLVRMCGESPKGNLFQLALAVVEGIGGGAIKLDSAMANHLRAIDAEMKALSEKGDSALSERVPAELGLALFKAVEGATKETPRIIAARKKFAPTAAPAVVEEEDEEVSFGPDDETLAAVSRILIEELNLITDKLDLYVRSPNPALKDLMDLVPQLEQIRGTLSVVGLTDHQTAVSNEITAIKGLEGSTDKPGEEALLNMAKTFLQIESALKAVVGDTEEGEEGFGDLSEAEATVIKETRNGLAQCKDAIIEYVTGNFDKAKIGTLPETLRALRGGLTIINQARSADVLLACAAYVEQRLLGGDAAPELSEMDDLADAITSIDYFLERYLENPKDPYLQMVHVAETSITKLGYEPGKLPPPPAARAAPEAEQEEEEEQEQEAAEPVEPAAIVEETPEEEPVEESPEAVIEPEVEAEVVELAEELAEAPAEEEEDLELESLSLEEMQPEPEAAVEDEAAEEVAEVAHEPESLVDDEILEIFIEEAQEVLGTIHEFFPVWRSNVANSEALTEVRRAFHTLKGSGRMVGATVVGELAWSVENMLNRVIDRSIEASALLLQVVADVIERIPEGIEKFKQGVQSTFVVDDLVARAEALAEGQQVDAQAAEEAGAEIEEVELDEALFEAKAEAPEPELEELSLEEIEAEEEVPVLEDVALDEVEGSDADDELDDIFVAEAEEKMAILRAHSSKPGAVSPDLIAAFHTLKGSAAMAEVQTVSQIAAPMEKLANQLYTGGTTDTNFDALVSRSVALIDGILADLSANRAHYDGVDEFCKAVEAVSSGTEVARRPAFDFENIRLLSTPDAVLEAWDEEQVSALQGELREVIEQARAIEQPDLEALAGGLLAVYGKLTDRPSDHVAEVLAHAHEHLVSMFDHIAASQDIIPAPEMVEALNALDVAPRPVAVAAPAPAAPGAAGAGELPEDEIDDDVLPLFLEEAEELTEAIDQSILDWSGDPDSSEPLDNLLRQLHTLKGSSRLAGLNSLGEYTHNFETFLIDVQKHPVDLDDAFFAILNERQDEITRRVGIYTRLAAGEATQEELASMRHGAAPAPRVATAPAAAPGPVEIAPEPAPAPPSAQAPAAAVVELPPDEIDEDVLPIFLEEADELVEAIDQSILDWSGDPNSAGPLDNLLRQLHTLKGGARTAGIASLGEFTHNFETFLIGIKQHPVPLDDAFFALVNQRQDEINRRVGIYKQLASGEASEEDLASMRTAPEAGAAAPAAAPSAPAAKAPAAAPAAREAPEAAEPTEAEAPKQAAAAGQQQQEMVRVSSDLLEELISLAGESSITRGRIEQQIADFGEALEEMEETIDRIREHVRRLEIEAESRETVFRTRQRDEEESGFDELEMDRYTMLQEISRALSEGSSDMMDLKDTLVNKSRDAETLLHQQARIASELQEGLTRTRMVPFARLIPRLRRIVRQISNEVGKSVRFDAYNVEGELDRNVLERIVAPLEHMLRNAVDHGIEAAEKRKAAGKPEQGRISLRLSREGGYVVLTVSDDGGGINLEAVKAKAIERGLITAESQVSDQEIRQFIMQAGFSTAQKLTQISGRGVGMDVVASEIKQLGGTINIDSTFGVGTEFTIQLPFTVSINRALMVVVQDETYAVPLNTIEGIYRVSPYELEAYYQPDAPMFEAAGQPYRLVYMGKLLDKHVEPNLEGQVVPLPVILARSGSNAVAFQVDRVIGSREVVVKSLGPQFNEVAGVSGATVMGDGSVVIILDLMALVRGADVRAAQAQPVQEAPQENKVRTVMIVDDSVTVRKVTSRLMERQGWEVLTAKDGMDAMAQLQEQYPDIVLLDIEMPRMDGFEVLRSVRRDDRLKNLPIIMITSRTGEKHKQQALELGVNRYLGKPFQEADLLVTIEEVIAEAKG